MRGGGEKRGLEGRCPTLAPCTFFFHMLSPLSSFTESCTTFAMGPPHVDHSFLGVLYYAAAISVFCRNIRCLKCLVCLMSQPSSRLKVAHICTTQLRVYANKEHFAYLQFRLCLVQQRNFALASICYNHAT